MDYIDIKYNVIGVIKSQLCSAIVNSESVRKALDFKGSNCEDYDPDDPFTLIHNCIIPWFQHPDTITTTEPLVFVSVKTSENARNPYLLNATATIICSVDKDDELLVIGKEQVTRVKADEITIAKDRLVGKGSMVQKTNGNSIISVIKV